MCVAAAEGLAEGEDGERREKLSAQASLLGESRAQAEAGLAEKEALRPTAFEPVADWPTFVTMMAHKMGNDTAFVLCVSPPDVMGRLCLWVWVLALALTQLALSVAGRTRRSC